jgi:hypothetical protein
LLSDGIAFFRGWMVREGKAENSARVAKTRQCKNRRLDLMMKRYLVPFVLLGAMAGPALAQSVESPACRIELATTWATMKEMVGRLKAVSRAPSDEKCAVYRTHVQVVTHTREVLARCKTGKEREGDLAQMDGALDDVNGALGRECGGTAQFTPNMRDPRAPQ